MAEPIEITNVGDGGVASEATLQSLVRAIEKMGGGKGNASAKKVQEAYTKSQQSGLKANTEFSSSMNEASEAADKAASALSGLGSTVLAGIFGAFGALKSSITGLAGELVNGGDTLTDFAKHVPVVGSTLSIFTSYLDNTTAAFRDLSSVGAGFGNNLKLVQDTAANLELGLGEFQSLVGSNSETLRLLGGTVTQGIAEFAKINKLMKAGPWDDLKAMGFTVMEINEGMVGYIELQRTLGRNEKMSAAEIARGSGEYLEQLDRLSKVTGKSRKEMEATMQRQAQDAGFRALMNQFDEGSEEAKNFAASMAMIDTLPADVAAGMKDLADGIPQTEAGVALLATAGPEMRDAMMKVAQGADPQVIIDAIGAAGVDIEKFSGLEGTERAAFIEQLRQSNPTMAGILDAATQMQKLGSAEFKAAQDEQAKRDDISSTLTTFDDKIKEIRASIAKAFLDSGLFENLGTIVGDLGTSFTELLKSDGFKNGLKEMFGLISDFVSNWKNFGFIDALFGNAEEGVNGLFGDLFGEGGPISKAMDKIGPKISEFLGDAFSSFVGNIFPSWDEILVGLLVGVGTFIAAMGATILLPISAPFLAIGAAIAGIAAMIGFDNLKELIGNAWDGISNFFGGIADWFANFSLTETLSNMWDTVTGFFSFGEEGFSLSALFGGVWETVTGYFSFAGEVWTGIGGLFGAAWETVTGYFSFAGEVWTGIGGLFGAAWDVITGYFSFAGEVWTGIGGLFGKAWESVTGWLSFGSDGEGFSISKLASDAWAKVTGFFSFGSDGEGFSVSKLMSDAWAKVTGFFSFGSGGEGEEGSGFSISGLVSNAWETVTGFFSFDNFTFPSISSLFDGVWSKLTGFFDFDFELPSFKSFLPSWMGGGDDTETETSTSSNVSIPDATPAVAGANALMDAQGSMQSFANIEGLQNNLDILKTGLDVNAVKSYSNAMEELVEVLGRLNTVLAEDNSGLFGSGTGVAAADALSQISTASQGNAQGTQQLNTIMNELLAIMTEVRDFDEQIEKNTKYANRGTNIANGRVSS